MKKSRILSAFLALVMLLGIFTTGVNAAWSDKVDEDENPIIDYMTQVYGNPDKKLAEMIMVKEEGGYQFWFEEFTGEVAVVDTASGQTFFTNPIDVAANASTSEAVKQKLLSQVIINYLDNDVSKEMNSYKEAALRDQITLKNIKSGMRVEYTLGEQQTTRLVPRLIEVSRFRTLVLEYIENDWLREKLESFYTLKDPNAPELTERGIIEMQSKFPITMEMAVYVCDPDIKARELRELENIIKQWCPLYTYEELDVDHSMTGYEGGDAAPPRFRLALEYKIVDGGFEVRLPANGIEFDESAYQFDTVQILPYFGTGSNTYCGYTMIPDGSGSLIRFEDVKGITYNISGQVYGADYAYHEISGQHSEVMRWPVWGVVTDYGEIAPERITSKPAGTDTSASSSTTTTTTADTGEIGEPVTYTLGYMALVTEGDSLATLMSEHGGTLHPYNTVYAKFTPRPSDTYNLADSISVSGSATWTVTSERKYTESYRIRYFLLTDPEVASERGVKNYYEASYNGMATALRDYWTATGTLSKLENVSDDIPLFIESFGAIETLERFLSFPMEVDTPLTTFEDIKTMHAELTELGIPNIDFRLTGFANGTMDFYTYPAKLKWTKAVGGDEGFTDLVNYAKENDIQIYPEFDFAYMNWSDAFDGVYRKRDAIKTIDDRYTVRRAYDPATQSFDRTFALCISPKSYELFYEKFGPVYAAFGNPSISLSTMGTDLNSDFDEDEPYHREDNKAYTIEFMEKMAADYENIMVEGGNAFTLPYVDVITNMSLESSQYVKASESIPFMGMVLHGSKVITGTPANMEGDINEMVLRSIESGASLYFVLSYQNTSRLKENMSTSKYYSVNYEIWKEDLVGYYTTLNEALKDVQDKYIVDHKFLEGERIPDADEAEADAIAAAAAAEALAEEEALAAEKEARAKRLEERLAKQNPAADDAAADAEVEEDEEDEEEDNSGVNEFGEVIVEEEEEKEVPAKYATTSGSIVYVEYENGTGFILNYNSFDITTEVNGKTYTVEGMNFVKTK